MMAPLRLHVQLVQCAVLFLASGRCCCGALPTSSASRTGQQLFGRLSSALASSPSPSLLGSSAHLQAPQTSTADANVVLMRTEMRLSGAEPQQLGILSPPLRPVDASEPDALLKFIVSELERSKREAGTLAPCEGIEVARIVRRPRPVENGIRYSIELKVKPVHIVTDRCNNNAVKDIIPSTVEECTLEVWEGMGPAGEMHPMAMLKSTCKLQKD